MPVSPLVEEQMDAGVRDAAPVRDDAAAPAPPPGGWRSTVAAASGLNILAGSG